MHAPTPTLAPTRLAERLHVARLWLKDERSRMGLGSFKALGAGHVIARVAVDRLDRLGCPAGADDLALALTGTVLVCASAGNHGVSVAAAAEVFGADARVYLSETVSEVFAQRLGLRGAMVVRAGDDYEASMAAARRDAEEHGWVLLADSSWPGYLDVPGVGGRAGRCGRSSCDARGRPGRGGWVGGCRDRVRAGEMGRRDPG